MLTNDEILLAARALYLEHYVGTTHLSDFQPDAFVYRELKLKLDAANPGGDHTFVNADTKQRQFNMANMKELKDAFLRKFPIDTTIPGTSEKEMFRAQRYNELQVKIGKLKKLHTHLQEVRVASPFDPVRPAASVSDVAANLFMELVGVYGRDLRIGIGGGGTMRQMARCLPVVPCSLKLSPINFARSGTIKQDEDYDSPTLTSMVRDLLRGSTADAEGLHQLPQRDPAKAAHWHRQFFDEVKSAAAAFRRSLESEVVFVGVGNFRKKHPTIAKIYRFLEIDHKKLSKLKPVGDINLCYFDERGDDLTGKILQTFLGEEHLPPEVFASGTFFPDVDHCHGFLLGMNIEFFKSMVRDGKQVVLVAGEEGLKTVAIQTLIRARVINSLVTDARTIDALTSHA